MKNKIMIVLVGLVLVIFIYYVSFLSSKLDHPALTTIPNKSLEQSICEHVATQFGDCGNILLYDRVGNVAFAETSSGIIPVLTNDDFTEFQKLILPMMDFQEFSEEKGDRGPIDWRAARNVKKDFSMIYGFAEDDAKTIVINSEGNIQPNKFLVRDNLWVWYVIVEDGIMKLPIEVTVYDAEGEIVYGGK